MDIIIVKPNNQKKLYGKLSEDGSINIDLSSGRMAKIDIEDHKKVTKYNWHLSSNKPPRIYAITNVYKNGRRTTLKMHRYVLNCSNPLIKTDHINGNGLDNRKSNLRLCSNQQNCWNQIKRKNSLHSKKYKGVDFHKNKWRARIRVSNKEKHIGYYKSEKLAAFAYDIQAAKYFGEFSNLNL